MLITNRVEIKYGLITLALITGLLVLNQTQTFSSLDHAVYDFFDRLAGFGFLGFFLIALLGNSTVLLHVPYNIPLLSLALGGSELDNLLLMGAASGLGGSLWGNYLLYRCRKDSW